MENAIIWGAPLRPWEPRRAAPAVPTVELAAVVEAIVGLGREAACQRADFGRELEERIDALCAAIVSCEKAGCTREGILRLVQPVCDIHLRCPFTSRLTRWPRGYPGDFETVEYLFEARNQALPRTIEHHYEHYALHCPAAQQHRNKLRYQAALILQTFVQRRAPRILSLAAGSCRDLQLIQEAIGGREGQILLNDVDPEALQSARAALPRLAHLCRFVAGNPLRVVRRLPSRERFDLIVAGGLFDYLPAKHIAALIAHVYAQLLAPRRRFFCTNIARGNPYRPWMEYLGDWRLIERSEEEIGDLCRSAGVDADHVTLRREETGLTILCEIVRPASPGERPRSLPVRQHAA